MCVVEMSRIVENMIKDRKNIYAKNTLCGNVSDYEKSKKFYLE